jgi:hypothetical protein
MAFEIVQGVKAQKRVQQAAVREVDLGRAHLALGEVRVPVL